MSFELTPVQGNVSELDTDLEAAPQHQREEEVIPVIKSAVKSIVDSVGGYLSVSVNGNLNPASGEPGDVVHIYITSLSEPASPESPSGEVVEPPAEVQPPAEENTENTVGEEPKPIEEPPLVEETVTPPVEEVTPPVETPVEEPEVPAENAPEVPVEETTPVESPPAVEEPVTTPNEAPTPTEEIVEGTSTPVEEAPPVGAEEGTSTVEHIEGDVTVTPEQGQ